MDDDLTTLLCEDPKATDHVAIANSKSRHQIRLAVSEYIKTGVLSKAAAAGSMSAGTLQRILARADVAQLVEDQIRIAEASARVTLAETMADLRYLADVALGRADTRLVVVQEGVPQSYLVRQTNPTAAKGALELLGKSQGAFVDRSEVSVNLPQMVLNMGGEPSQERVVGEGTEPVDSEPQAPLVLGPAEAPDITDEDWL